MIYRLPECINKETLYRQILPDLTKRYRNIKKGEETAVSLVQTSRIDSNALPLFVGMLNLLEHNSGRSVYLELAYTPRLLAFLEISDFFNVLSKYNIIYYDEEYIGGFPNYHYNKKNKILPYVPILDYEKNSNEKKWEIRDGLAEKVRGDLLCNPIFGRESTPIRNDELWDTTMITVTELIVNAIIYSGSMSYVYMKTGINYTDTKKGHLISVVDVGHGFYKSLSEKIQREDGYTQERRDEFYHYARKLGINIEKEINFLSIMEALYYSQEQARNMDLFKLKNLLAISQANLRIHQKNREIVFTYERCSRCADRDILHCMECFSNRNKTEKAPIKAYPVSMAGVHIEVEFIQEK